MTARRRPWFVAGLQRRPLVVGEAGERVDHRGEVRRGGPRRAGVLGLVEERGHPGHEEQDPDADRDQGRPRCLFGVVAVAGAPDGRAEPDDDHGDQVHRPVLGVEERRRHHRDGDQVARPGRADRPFERQEPEPGEQDDQRVHPRLGGVVHGEGRAGDEREHRPGGGPAAEALPAEPGDGEGQDGENAGERTDGLVGLAEEADPVVQQDVIERRGPVVLEQVGELAQGLARDVDGEGLVEPQARAGPEAEEDAGGDDQREDHTDGGARATAERRNLLRHGPHGRTRGTRSRIIRRRWGRF